MAYYSFMGIKWGPSLGVQEGPTCEYLSIMPIKDTDTGAIKVLEIKVLASLTIP